MADRTFTLEEAQSLLSVLESLLRTSIDGKKLIESVDAELQETAHRVFLNGGMFLKIVHLARRKAERLGPLRVGVVAFSATADTELGDYDENPVILFKAGRLPHPFDEA